MNDDLASPPPAEPAPAAPDVIGQLEARARRLRSLLGLSAAVLLLPAYVWLVFVVLREVQPRALGTYALLVGSPVAMGLMCARPCPGGFWRWFGLTSAALVAMGIGLHALELEKGLYLVIMLLPIVAFFALSSLVVNLGKLRVVSAALRDARLGALLLLIAQAN